MKFQLFLTSQLQPRTSRTITQKEITILKETSNAKSQLVLLEWTPCLCLRFVLYDMRLGNTFIIAMIILYNAKFGSILCKTE